MASIWDKVAGVIATGKESLGLQDIDLVPGDVTQKLTGVNSNFIYGTPTSNGGRNYDAQTPITSPNVTYTQPPTNYAGGVVNKPNFSSVAQNSGSQQKITDLDSKVTDPNGVNKTKREAIAEGLMDEYGNWINRSAQSQEDAARAQAEARRQAAMAKYNAAKNIAGRAKETAKGRYDWLIGEIGSNKQDLLSKVQLSEDQGLANYDMQQEQTQRQYDSARNEIMSTYQDLNREQEKILRGSGMSSSSRSQEAQLRLNNLLGKDLSTVSTNEADSLALIGNAITTLKQNSQSTRDSIEREATGKMNEAAMQYSEQIAQIDNNMDLSELEREQEYAQAEADLKTAVAQVESWVAGQQMEYAKWAAQTQGMLDDYIVGMTDVNGLLGAGLADKESATNQFLQTIGQGALMTNPNIQENTSGVYQKAASKEELDKLLAAGQISRAQYDSQVAKLQQPQNLSGTLMSTLQTPKESGASATLVNRGLSSAQNRIVNQDPLLASILA